MIAFNNAAAEAFFSTLEHELLSRQHFTTKAQTRQVVVAWCQDFYNSRRRHSSAALMSPIQYERLAADQPAATYREAFTIRGEARGRSRAAWEEYRTFRISALCQSFGSIAAARE